MRILVTGGAGFIGSHTCLALLEKGHEIIVIDSYVNSNPESLNRVVQLLKLKQHVDNVNIRIFKADIRDESTLDQLFYQYKESGKPIQAVIHFAGLKSVNDSVLNPLLYWDANVSSSVKLFKVMNKYKCKTIVFSSSATIYGITNDTSLLEDSEVKPINPYGNTKAAIELILNDIFDSNPEEWRIANLRYFNPIGAHSSGMIGEDPIGLPSNIFPFITKVAVGQIEKLMIFGNDWPTNDGTGVRDYIHVMDLAEGHIAALEFLINSKSQIINLNLGNGIGTSVLKLVKTFEKVNNIEIKFEFANRRIGDCCSVIADNSMALSCLDWKPKRSLEEMCIDGWSWQSLNPDGYK